MYTDSLCPFLYLRAVWHRGICRPHRMRVLVYGALFFGDSIKKITSSCVYNVINTRMNAGLPTFITTNLTNESIKSRYGLRVYSRLFNEYRVIRLMGGDVRGAIHG